MRHRVDLRNARGTDGREPDRARAEGEPRGGLRAPRGARSRPADRQAILDDLFRNITLYENKASRATWTKRPDGKYVVQVQVAAAKYRAEGKGKETPAPLDDWIDIGVFGEKEAKGPSEGRLLAMEKRHVEHADETFEMVVDQEPKRAGIDPFNKLIDRNPEDNLVSVTAASAPATSGAASVGPGGS